MQGGIEAQVHQLFNVVSIIQVEIQRKLILIMIMHIKIVGMVELFLIGKYFGMKVGQKVGHRGPPFLIAMAEL